MYFEPKLFKASSEEILSVSDKCRITGDFPKNTFWESTVADMAKEQGTIAEIIIHNGFSDDVKHTIAQNGNIYDGKCEEYAIVLDSRIEIYATSELGVRNAIMTLKQLSDFGELKAGFIYDYPEKEFRGLKLFTPGREQFEDFKKIIDLMAYFKNNVLILEVAGAMEYKRHPRINIAWEECVRIDTSRGPLSWMYSKDKYNYATVATQIHNGEGSYITQEEMKELVAYCNDRGIEVIPEVPSYSHCDYIVRAYPMLRETVRALRHADVYCPSNPDTYKVLFDIIDEVARVFKPKYIHIAHDELCISDECKRCRATGKSPARIFADDVTKIHDYLALKDIKTMMWSDVAMEVATGFGYNRPGDWDYVPPRFDCRDMLPRDIVMMNWQWAHTGKHDDDLLNRGYSMIYGNLTPHYFPNWKGRSKRDGVLGGVVSAWCAVEDKRLRLYKVYIGLVYYAYLYWTDGFEESRKEEVFYKAAEECYRYYNKYIVPASDNVIEVTHALSNCKAADFVDTNCQENGGNTLPIGFYLVTYQDGTCAKLPVIYRQNIVLGRLLGGNTAGTECTALEVGTYEGKTYYKCAFQNPNPGKNIVSINFVKEAPIQFDLTLSGINIG